MTALLREFSRPVCGGGTGGGMIEEENVDGDDEVF